MEFEAACEDLFARLTAPIDAALKMAGKTLADVQSVELLGERERERDTHTHREREREQVREIVS